MKTNTQRKSETPPQRKEVQKEKGPAQRRVLIFPVDLGGAAQETPDVSRLDRIEVALKNLRSDRHADQQPGYPAPPFADAGRAECGELRGCQTSAPVPTQSGVMQGAASLLSRLTILTERFSRVRFVLRRVPSEASNSAKERSHEDLAEIQSGQYDRVTHLENLAYEIETELGIG